MRAGKTIKPEFLATFPDLFSRLLGEQNPLPGAAGRFENQKTFCAAGGGTQAQPPKIRNVTKPLNYLAKTAVLPVK